MTPDTFEPCGKLTVCLVGCDGLLGTHLIAGDSWSSVGGCYRDSGHPNQFPSIDCWQDVSMSWRLSVGLWEQIGNKCAPQLGQIRESMGSGSKITPDSLLGLMLMTTHE